MKSLISLIGVFILIILVASVFSLRRRVDYYERLTKGQGMEIEKYDSLRNKVSRIVIEHSQKGTAIPFVPSDKRYTKKWGLNFKPAIVCGIHSRLDLGIDFNVFFIGKYGLNFGAVGEGLFYSLSYSLRDLPLVDNTDAFLGFVHPFDLSSNRKIIGGFRVSF